MKKLRLFSIMFLLAISCCLFSACGSNITLTINFDSNGGTSCKSIEYVVGKSFNMPDDPTKENYVFGGWYEDNGVWEKPFTTSTVLNYPLNKNMDNGVFYGENFEVEIKTLSGKTEYFGGWVQDFANDNIPRYKFYLDAINSTSGVLLKLNEELNASFSIKITTSF